MSTTFTETVFPFGATILPLDSGIFNVKAYGAIGNGAADDTAAVNAAIQAAIVVHGLVWFPAGTYLVTSSIVVNGLCMLRGVGYLGGSGSIIHGNGNFPIIHATVPFDGRDFAVTGTSNVSGLQDGIFFDATSGGINLAYLSGVVFDQLYNGLHLKDSVFYGSANNLTFLRTVNAGLRTEGTAASGWDFLFEDCKWLPSTPTNYCAQLDNVGGAYFNDCRVEGQGGVTIDTFLFNTAATNFGGVFMDGTVIETANGFNGIAILGTSGKHFGPIYLTGTTVGGGSSSSNQKAAIQFGYCDGFQMNGGELTGLGTGLNVINSLTDSTLTGVNFQCVTGVTAANAAVINGLDLGTCTFPSVGIFMFLTNTSNANLSNIRVTGRTGSIGSNVNPVQLGSGAVPATIFIDVPDFNAGSLSGPLTPISTTISNPFMVDVVVCVQLAAGDAMATVLLDGEDMSPGELSDLIPAASSMFIPVRAGGTIRFEPDGSPSFSCTWHKA